MKTNYKKIILVGAVLILMPFLVSAKSENANQEYCNRITNAYSKISQRIEDLNGKLTQKRSQIANRLEERRNNRDARFVEKREKWDANREQHFAALEEKAGTDEQKQALLDFKQIVSKAIIDRREAVDQAIRDFRTGVENLKSSRLADINQLINSYRNELRLAFEKAKNDCSNESDQKPISQNLRNQLRIAKSEFLDDRKLVDKIREGIQELIGAKKEAVQKAKDDFKETVSQALEDLKLVFPEIEDEEEDSD